MRDLPLMAWVLLCALAVMIIIMNLALIAMVRKGSNFQAAIKLRRPKQDQPKIDDMVKVLRDPFAEERRQLEELSGLVHKPDEKDRPGGKP